MPLCVSKKGEKFRLVECMTGDIAKNQAGTALDGGGFPSKAAAIKQMQAVNLSMLRARGRRDVPAAPK